jgi:ATP-dependent Clp protease adapter protein ClpS
MIQSDLDISQAIIDEINTLDKECSIIAFNNDVTPFHIVFYVLRTVVPLSDDKAYEITYKIHLEGKATVYTGNKEHCYKIGDALKKINVEYEIIN